MAAKAMQPSVGRCQAYRVVRLNRAVSHAIVASGADDALCLRAAHYLAASQGPDPR
jgi:hypothetical protein